MQPLVRLQSSVVDELVVDDEVEEEVDVELEEDVELELDEEVDEELELELDEELVEVVEDEDEDDDEDEVVVEGVPTSHAPAQSSPLISGPHTP